jgi:hypothetical protein
MKFTEAQVKEFFERSALKMAVLCLSVIAFTFSVLLALDLSKEPIVVERSCESRILKQSSSNQSKEEILEFVSLAIGLRFDTNPSREPSAFLIQDLYLSRAKEQEDLKRSQVDQRFVVRAVRESDGSFIVEGDRLVAIGRARSAIPIVLKIQLSATGRSLTNPYGLMLISVEQVKEEVKNE